MIDKETISVYNTRISEYKELTTRDKPDLDLTKFVELLPADSFVLDLGCGPAAAAAYIKSQGHRVDPVDASYEMVKAANEAFDIGARQATFDDIDGNQIYDGVWANFSLLHAEPEKFPIYLKAIAQALRNYGVFHIGMKLKTDDEAFKRDKIGRYYSYYSEEELVQHLSEAGFTTHSVTPGEGIGLAGDMEPWIVILSKKMHK